MECEFFAGFLLQTLRQQFEEKTSEQQSLQQKADVMSRRLEAASRLIAGLESERTRWTRDMIDLEAKKTQLVGDCLLTSAFLSYAGNDSPHNSVYQQIELGLMLLYC